MGELLLIMRKHILYLNELESWMSEPVWYLYASTTLSNKKGLTLYISVGKRMCKVIIDKCVVYIGDSIEKGVEIFNEAQ